MAKVMMTLRCEVQPTLDQVRERYRLDLDEIDESFGVVEIDPDERLYTIRVEEAAAKKFSDTDDWKVEGPYSDPGIEPFGPPES